MLEGGELRRAGDRAGREGGVDRVGPADARPQPALDRGHQVARGPGAVLDGEQRRARAPMPHSHTRPRSLRTRSTIITFSARSLGRKPSAVAAVPLMGDDHTTSAVAGDRNRSGDAEATWTPCVGQAHDRAERRRVAARRAPRRGRRRRRRPGSGAGMAVARVRLTWYTSPAAMAARMVVDAGLERRSVEATMSTRSRAGPATAARPGRGRAHVGEAGADRRAVEGQHDRPEPRRVEGGEVVGDVDQVGAAAGRRRRRARRTR